MGPFLWGIQNHTKAKMASILRFPLWEATTWCSSVCGGFPLAFFGIDESSSHGKAHVRVVVANIMIVMRVHML